MEVIESLGYQVYFDDTLASLEAFLAERNYSKIIVLVDTNTLDNCLPLFQQALPNLANYDVIEVDPGEENKNIDFCIGVWHNMLDFGADRHSLMINLGGGVVTDMGGFAASTFKRGMDFIQIPTTLLSQVDASVGGKTGIDMGSVKNIIGTFAQPQAVFISSQFLKTLDQRQLISGFAEVIKHGLIFDRAYYERVKTLEIDQIDNSLVKHSVSIKNRVILEDPKEKGLRKILNFGHTIGHAIEGYSLLNDASPLLHGEAIAVGMICEGYLSHKLNGLPLDELNDLIQTFRKYFNDYTFDSSIDTALLDLMRNDKKNLSNQIGFALLDQIGSCQYDIYVSEDDIIESLDFYRELITK
ncbi:3-dehydroquinate synthase [Sphingobacterium siyangense]|uniref:3-dehydroquinate synthase n=2 Tax=Sphingobacterium TaxID=28453 RepID=A0ABX7CJP5_SPHMU|nr:MULTISPECIES: 3-dehydroquinate synthase [Sphingobacterium]QQT51455.1 3-dehydroquinate synthase [Sphingobacterium multivorum]QRY56526.1 3-dehydroquinate synthase [Sphingobacterium siyangense]RKF34846.1 3-dehydroquinate synthase [Sphingobacterium siyangense]